MKIKKYLSTNVILDLTWRESSLNVQEVCWALNEGEVLGDSWLSAYRDSYKNLSAQEITEPILYADKAAVSLRFGTETLFSFWSILPVLQLKGLDPAINNEMSTK